MLPRENRKHKSNFFEMTRNFISEIIRISDIISRSYFLMTCFECKKRKQSISEHDAKSNIHCVALIKKMRKVSGGFY